MPGLPGTPADRARLFARFRRWTEQADARVVRLFWRQAGDEPVEAICALCRRELAPGESSEVLAGTRQEVLDLAALAGLPAAAPLFASELWYAVCALCLPHVSGPLAGNRAALNARVHRLADRATGALG